MSTKSRLKRLEFVCADPPDLPEATIIFVGSDGPQSKAVWNPEQEVFQIILPDGLHEKAGSNISVF